MALKRYRLSIWKNGLAAAAILPSSRSWRRDGLCIHFANAAKFSDSSRSPCSRNNSIALTTRNSVNPFGVPWSRRMYESDIAGRP